MCAQVLKVQVRCNRDVSLLGVTDGKGHDSLVNQVGRVWGGTRWLT